MASYYSMESLPTNAKLPDSCPLHLQKMSGRLSFTMDEDGNYPAGAPPCLCMLGIQDAIDKSLFQKVLKERNAKIEKETGLPWAQGLEKYKEMFPLEYKAYEEEFKRLSGYPKK